MQAWLRISMLLCTFGFFREMRPSEPFVTEYLSGDRFNITSEQVNKEVYPFGTYSNLAQLIIIFLITDILRYKPLIVVSACAGIALFAFLLWSNSIGQLQIAQVFYGTFMASEVAYYTYIYAKVERNRYQIVTGHTRAAILCGKFLGGVLAQVLISTETMDFRELHYISFGSQIISFFFAVALPSVPKSLYFYTDQITEPPKEARVETPTPTTATATRTPTEPEFSWKNAIQLIGHHIVSAYSKPIVVQWSIWWALANCGQLQVISYIQFLWRDIDPNHENFYNGAVEAAVTIFGAAGAMTAGLMTSIRNKELHIWIITICSTLMGAFLVISAVTNLVWIAYAMYILFGIFYFFVITIASALVAENLSEDSFGLIFGINTLVALGLQTILTLVVVTDTGYGMHARHQYIVYGCYFTILAGLFCTVALVRFIWRKSNWTACCH